MSVQKADFLIVGAGFSGATFARCAADAGLSCHVIDKRDHVGGNSYSYCDEETGVEVHKYGAHIFHTSSPDVWSFVCRFTEFNRYINRVKATSNGQVYGLPINLLTMNQFFRRAMDPVEARQFVDAIREPQTAITNFEQYVLDALGRDLYEAFFLHYTVKHWGRHPSLISVSTAKRLPIRYNYNDNYFDDLFQGIPADGYGKLFERMLQSPNIKVDLSTDFRSIRDGWRSDFRHLVYTGPIDEYFRLSHGRLPYRTIRFKELRGKEILGNAVMNYCDMSVPFTRTHEHKWFTPEKRFERSIAFEEYASEASENDDGYYPVINKESAETVNTYRRLAEQDEGVIFLGRLAEFKYYDMHQAVGAALARFRSFTKNAM